MDNKSMEGQALSFMNRNRNWNSIWHYLCNTSCLCNPYICGIVLFVSTLHEEAYSGQSLKYLFIIDNSKTC